MTLPAMSPGTRQSTLSGVLCLRATDTDSALTMLRNTSCRSTRSRSLGTSGKMSSRLSTTSSRLKHACRPPSNEATDPAGIADLTRSTTVPLPVLASPSKNSYTCQLSKPAGKNSRPTSAAAVSCRLGVTVARGRNPTPRRSSAVCCRRLCQNATAEQVGRGLGAAVVDDRVSQDAQPEPRALVILTEQASRRPPQRPLSACYVQSDARGTTTTVKSAGFCGPPPRSSRLHCLSSMRRTTKRRTVRDFCRPDGFLMLKLFGIPCLYDPELTSLQKMKCSRLSEGTRSMHGVNTPAFNAPLWFFASPLHRITESLTSSGRSSWISCSSRFGGRSS
eukprot:m.148102 g.148102  ORF g.148102 m.148102 type:complete len:334 (+) comp11666_c0_seq29:788-1789(+)